MPKPQPPRTLNLLQESEKPVGTWDKIYKWVFNVGRYVIIVIEVVVLVGFVARFSLDRKNNDLKDKIEVKVSMLKAERDVEAELRNVQTTLTNFSQLIDSQEVLSTSINRILALIPSEMNLQSISINKTAISIQCTAPTYEIAERLEQDLRTEDGYGNVTVSVEKGGSGSEVIFNATFNIIEADEI